MDADCTIVTSGNKRRWHTYPAVDETRNTDDDDNNDDEMKNLI